MNLKSLLQQQGLSVRQLAAELEVPLKTVQDWVYRGVVPSPANQAKLSCEPIQNTDSRPPELLLTQFLAYTPSIGDPA